MNLRNVGERLGTTPVALVGVAGVVTVVVGVLSINEGFRAVLQRAGADDIVIADAEQIARDGGTPIVSSELYVTFDVPMKSTGTAANVPLRGVNAAAAANLRQGFEITAGRMFTPGTFEVIVGRGAVSQFLGVEVGQTIRAGTTAWTVVGHSRDCGSVVESEVWTDAPVLQGAYNRGTNFQSVRAPHDPAGVTGVQGHVDGRSPAQRARVHGAAILRGAVAHDDRDRG